MGVVDLIAFFRPNENHGDSAAAFRELRGIGQTNTRLAIPVLDIPLRLDLLKAE